MIDKKKIEDEAKSIMDEFLEKLEAVKEEQPEYVIKRDESQRTVFENTCEADFWDRALQNAPSADGRALKMEKKRFDQP